MGTDIHILWETFSPGSGLPPPRRKEEEVVVVEEKSPLLPGPGPVSLSVDSSILPPLAFSLLVI